MTKLVPAQLLPRRAITRVAASALIAATLAAAGCAAFTPETPEETVSRRAQERWDALIKGNFPKAYTYTQPGYRATVTEKQYASRFGDAGAWKSVQIYETKCEAERCSVRLRLTTQLLVGLAGSGKQETRGFISETWIKDDGQWWYYQSF